MKEEHAINDNARDFSDIHFVNTLKSSETIDLFIVSLLMSVQI